MKVFMLGWEFPPIVSGGLGVACYGLAKALNGRGVDVLFVLPKPRGANGSSHTSSKPPAHQETRAVPAPSPAEVQHAVEQAVAHAAATEAAEQSAPPPPAPSVEHVYEEDVAEIMEEIHATDEQRLQRVTFVPLDAWLQPYMTAEGYQQMVVEELVSSRPVTRWEKRFVHQGGRWVERARSAGPAAPVHQPPNTPPAPPPHIPAPPPFRDMRSYIEEPKASDRPEGPANSHYAGDLFAETERYARLALAVAKNDDDFDLIHAHDWMTFEAAMAVANETGAPLVVQIHSTELDRAGHAANSRIMEVERQGMLAADLVIAVSYKTKTQLIDKYGIDPQKIEVVYNATEPKSGTPSPDPADASPRDKNVLFLGRLTRQKGPGYFLHAAKKVLSVDPNVHFTLAGTGDMAHELRQLASDLGIRRKIIFAGFLKKPQAEKALQHADVYVMPSVSEPFGIAPLEALANDVPVIISKQSGVAEVLQHVLKVDFWDTDDLANKILAVLRHPPLAATLRERGAREVRQLSWDDSADKIIALYDDLVEEIAPAEEPPAITPTESAAHPLDTPLTLSPSVSPPASTWIENLPTTSPRPGQSAPDFPKPAQPSQPNLTPKPTKRPNNP